MPKVAIAFIFLIFGVLLGNAVENVPEPSHDTVRVVKVPVIETREVAKPYVPESCRELPRLAAEVTKAVSTYEAVLGRESAVQDQSYMAMNSNNQILMNKAEQEHRSIMSATLDAALEMAETNKALKSATDKCRDDMSR